MLNTLKDHVENLLSSFLYPYQRYGVVWWVGEGNSREYHITYFAAKKAALRSVSRKSKRYGEAYGVQSCLEIKERELVRFEVLSPVELERAAFLSLYIWGQLSARTKHTSFINIYSAIRGDRHG